MSQVARVFVVLNLVLAAGFLFAAATFLALNNDYKAKYEGEQEGRRSDNEQKDLVIVTKDGEINALRGQKSALTEERGQLTGARDALHQQVQSLESEKKTKDNQIAELTRINDTHGQTVASLRSDKQGLLDQNSKLAEESRAKAKEAMEAVVARDAANQTIEAQKQTIHDRDKAVVAQGEKIGELELQKAYAVSKGIDFENVEVMKPLHGSVVNADNAMRLVQVNIGSSQGMKRGYMMDVVRGNQYIGRVRIDTVYGSQSAGLLTILKAGQSVMVGDRVTNTLN